MINKFDREYSFLSNFEPINILEMQTNGAVIIYPTVEHAFQAAKTHSIEEKMRVANEQTPGKAKRAGGKNGYVTLRSDWEQVKDSVMLHYLRIKFNCPGLCDKLLETGEELLVEGNNWGDDYWGVCTPAGKNRLGTLLMQVREELRAMR